MSDGRPATPRRGFWRRAMRAVVVLCLLLVVLGAVLHLPPVQRRLVGAVFTRLQDRLGLAVGFEDFRFNLVTRTVTIDRLQVGVPGAPAPLVAAPRVHVSFPLAAFQGDADGLDVELVDAQVALVRENDRWTTMPARWFDRSDEDGGGGGGVPAFARLAFRNLSVRYEDRNAGFRADTTGFTADLRPSITAARLAGDIQPGAVTRIGWGDRGTTATFEGGRMFFSPDGAGVDALRLSLPEGTVDADVRFAFGEDPAISLTADANLRAEALDRWTDVLEPAAGPLRVRLTMPATGGEGLADLQVRSPGFSWRGFEISALDGAGVLATTHVTFETLGLNVGGGRIQGEARLAWSDRMTSRATAAGTNLDAGALFRVFDVDAMRLLAPASLVSGRFSGSWPSWDADRLSGSLQSAWRARPSGLTAGERWWFDGRLDVRFREGPWVLSVDQRMSGALDLDGTVQIASDRTRDFGDWGLGGRLALAGSTPATLGAAASLFDTTVPVDLEAASGTLTGQASLDGHLGAPLADVDLVSTLAWPDQPEIATATSARVGADRIVVHRFDAESGPSALTAEAEIDLDADRIAGRFEGRRVAVEAWTRRFGWGTPIEAELDAAGTLEGPLDAPVVSAQVETGPLALAGQSFPGGLSADVRYDTRSLAAGQIRLAQPDGAVTGRAEWTRDGGQVAASLQLANLAVGSDVPGLTGRAAGQPVRLEAHVDGSATVSGTLDRPAVTARLEAPALMLDDRSLGAVSAVIETAEGRVTATIRAPELGLTADGSVGLAAERPFEVTARIATDDAPIELSAGSVPIQLGAIDLSARARGTLAAPSLDTLEVAVNQLAGVVADLPVRAEPGARVTWAPGQLVVEQVEVDVGEAHLRAAGRLEENGGAGLVVRAEGLLQGLRPAVVLLGGERFDQAVLEGPFCVAAHLTGPPDAARVTGSLDFDGVRIGVAGLPPLEGVWVRLGLNDERLQVNLAEARWQGAHVAVTGSVPSRMLGLPQASPGGEAELEGHVDEITLAVLEPFFESEALSATSFRSRVTFTARAAEPTLEAVVADVQIAEAVLKSGELGLAQRRPASLHLEDGVLMLEPWTLGTPWSTRTQLTLAGGVRFGEPVMVDLAVDGRFDLRAAGLLLGTYRPAGLATFDLRVKGPADSPALAGAVQLQNGELLIRDPRLLFHDLTGALRFVEGRIIVDDLQGTLNGGRLTAAGSMRQPGLGEPDGAIVITARNVLLNEPAGVRSVINADVQLRERRTRGFQLAGTVEVEQAVYRETLLLTGGLLSLLQPSDTRLDLSVEEPDGESAPPLLTLDIRVNADDSIAVDTTVGRVTLGADIRVQGPADNPRITGQASLAPGGELYLGGRTYRVESGLLEWRDPTTRRPEVRLVARTTAGGYDVTLRVESRDGVTETDLTSDPFLPEEEIASLLLYGDRTASGARAGELVTEQLAAALSGELVGAVGRAFGIDSVRVGQDDPADVLFDSSLISSDSNPAQRITFSKRVFPDLEVIVSQSLRESGDVTWIVSWEPLRHFELRFVQLDNRDRSYEVRYDLSFGGTPPATSIRRTARPTERVRDVQIVAEGDVSEAAVRAQLELTEGDRFDFFEWQEDRDRIVQWLLNRGYYEAVVHSHRDPPAPPEDSRTVTPVGLIFEVESGPRTVLSVSGIDLPDAVQQSLIEGWSAVPVDPLIAEELTGRLRRWLAMEGYLRPEVTVDLRRQPDAKVALVRVEPGPQFTDRVFLFRGNNSVPAAELQRAVEAAALSDRAWAAPELVEQLVRQVYRQRGYLAAEVEAGEPVLAAPRAELPVRIEEGPLFRAGSVRVDDPAPQPAEDVDASPPIASGEILTDRAVAAAVRELRRRYLLAGYRRTRVRAQSTADEASGTVDLVFRVTRGPRLHLRELRVEGARTASEAAIADAVGIAPGEPVSTEILNNARDRLYDMGLFRTVTVETQAIAEAGQDDRPGRRLQEPLPDAEPRLVDAVITVEEMPRYRLRFGTQLFDPVSDEVDPMWGEVDPGVVADFSRRGLFGRGITAGLGARVNPSQQAARAYLTSRTFFGLPAQTNLYVGEEREQVGVEPLEIEFRQRDFTVEQRIRRARLVQVYYGYRFSRLRLDAPIQIPGQPIPLPITFEYDISRLLGSAVLDRRDSAIDTTRGWFHSSSFDIAPERLGTTAGFNKYLGQLFFFQPVRSGVVFASAARVELASGPGRELIVSERLRSGGASTLRGYVDDTATLRTVTDFREGTTGISVFNQELRFPLFWRLSGAGFWDHGSLFGDLGAFEGLRNRDSVGAGVRLLLPFILVRVDYGHPLRRDGINDQGRWYLAIGQAF